MRLFCRLGVHAIISCQAHKKFQWSSERRAITSFLILLLSRRKGGGGRAAGVRGEGEVGRGRNEPMKIMLQD